jgi:hypothetical protein
MGFFFILKRAGLEQDQEQHGVKVSLSVEAKAEKSASGRVKTSTGCQVRTDFEKLKMRQILPSGHDVFLWTKYGGRGANRAILLTISRKRCGTYRTSGYECMTFCAPGSICAWKWFKFY